MQGIYIHVPFCQSKCPYCDFYSKAPDGSVLQRYKAAVLSALSSCPYTVKADTLYFGGGTPTLLPPESIGEIIDASSKFACGEFREITCEANPNTLTLDILKGLLKAGVNRLSIGVQSTDDRILKILSRRHSAKQALEAIAMARQAGFKRISADLMIAIPGQTVLDVISSIDALCEIGIEHLSAYILRIEPGTPFYNSFSPLDDDFVADMWQEMCAAMKNHGFTHYEISNFSVSDAARSMHNMHYWRCDGYLGVGPSAHSFLDGKRFYFPRDIDSFLNAKSVWDTTVPDGEGGDEEERVMLALRLLEGFSLSTCSPQFREKLSKRIPPLVSNGLALIKDDKLSLTEKGMLVSNSVISFLLS